MDPLTAIVAAPVATKVAFEAIDRTLSATDALGTAFGELFSSAVRAPSLRSNGARESNGDWLNHPRRDSPETFRYLFAALTGREPAHLGESPSPSEIRQHAASLLERLRQRLQPIWQQLSAAADSHDGPIELEIDPADGTVRVAEDWPGAAEFAKLLAEDPQLTREIRYVAALLELVAAADEHAEFATLHARDPEFALSEFHHLLEHDKNRRLRISV